MFKSISYRSLLTQEQFDEYRILLKNLKNEALANVIQIAMENEPYVEVK